MTLVDTRPGIKRVWDELSASTGVVIDSDLAVSRLGPPLSVELAHWVEADQVDTFIQLYRDLYPEHAIADSLPLPGAVDALAAVRRHGGSTVVVTAKNAPNARQHMDHLVARRRRGRRRPLGIGQGRRAAHARGLGLRGRPRPRRRRRPSGGRGVRRGPHRAVHCGRAAGGRSRRRARRPPRLRGLARRARAGHPLGRARGTTARGGQPPRRLQRWRRLGPSARCGCAHPRSRPGGRRHRCLGLTAGGRAGPGGGVRGVSRGPPCHAADPRDGPRGLPRQRRRPLLLLQGGAGRRARTTGRTSSVSPRSRPAPTPTTRWPDSARASAPPPSAEPSRHSLDAGLTKAQVRELSRRWDLPTWDKPAAACLSSRIAYGIEVTSARLSRVERAELAVREVLAAYDVPVRDLRVRDLGDEARIELDGATLAVLEVHERSLGVLRGGRGGARVPLGVSSIRRGSAPDR